MEGAFHFVDVLRTDKASKRLMRRHVMKGKNAGRTIHRRARREAPRCRRPEIVTSRREEETEVQKLKSPAAMPQCLQRQTLGLSTPVGLTPYSLGVINKFFAYVADRMYPVHLGLTLEDTKRLWLQLLVTDEASHHCNVALLDACNQLFLLGGDSSPQALYHLSEAYAHIQKRLASPDALSDSTIGLVVAFIHQEQIKKGGSQARIHFDGLRRMVALRGGIGELEGNLPLTLKICKTDVIFTLQFGGPSAFFRDRMPDVRDSIFRMGPGGDPTAPPIPHEGLDPRLHGVLVDALYISSIFNGHSRHHRVSLIVYQEMVLSMFYRLLHFRPLEGPRQGSDLDAAYHTGLVVFTMTIFLQCQRQRCIDSRLSFQCLRDTLETAIIERERELVLWVVVVGGVWMWNHPGGEWLAPKLSMASEALGIETWDDACTVLKKFPWLDCIHDEPGRQVWERALEDSRLGLTCKG